MTLIGGLLIVTRQYAGDRWDTRIWAAFVGVLTSVVGFVGAFTVAIISPLIVCLV
jgi:hypothetical protein